MHIDQVSKAFDSAYASDACYFGKDVFSALPELIELQAHSINKTALDLGCGQGRDTLFLAQNGYAVTAVDCSKTAIEQVTAASKQLNQKVKCVHSDIKLLQLLSHSFDIVVARTVLHHFRKDDLGLLMPRIKAAVKHRGFFVGTVFATSGPNPNDSEHQLVTEFADTIAHQFTPCELLEWFNDWRVHLYQIKRQLDQSHGHPHIHVTAKLIAERMSQ